MSRTITKQECPAMERHEARGSSGGWLSKRIVEGALGLLRHGRVELIDG